MLQTILSNTPIDMYKFCPKCGEDFKHQGGNHLKCLGCGYNYFVNQAATVGAIILDDEGKVMLAKRKFEPKKGTWQSVGGFVGLDENLESALAREVKEELGVGVVIKNYLGSFSENYEFGGVSVPFLAIYFIAIIVNGTPKASDDVEEFRYFALDELGGLDITYPDLRDLLRDYLKSYTNS